MDVHEVRQLVARGFVELGAKTVFPITDTLFIEDGRCMAVAYRTDDLSAVWCVDEGTVEFRRDGQLLRTIRLPAEESLPSQVA